MRRIAAVALTVGTLIAGVTATATPAQAASKGTWVTKNGWKVIKADGKYTKNSKKVVIGGTLRDYKGGDGWSPGVQFLTKEKQGSKVVSKTSDVFYVKNLQTDKPMDRKDSYSSSKIYSSSLTGNLYVREVALKVSDIDKAKFGPWKKIY